MESLCCLNPKSCHFSSTLVEMLVNLKNQVLYRVNEEKNNLPSSNFLKM